MAFLESIILKKKKKKKEMVLIGLFLLALLQGNFGLIQGDHWSTKVVSTESTDNSLGATLTIDSKDYIHMVWYDYTAYASSGVDADIFYKYLNAITGIWSTTEVVSTESTENSWSPTLVIDSQDNLHVAWDDFTAYASSGPDRDIFYKYLNATTGIWSTTEVVSTQSTADSVAPTMVIDSQDNPHMVWSDYTDYTTSGADLDIFYKYLNATTGIWSTTEVVSTESTADSLQSTLVIDSQDNLHVVWEDFTDYATSGADGDMFYKYLNAITGIWSTTELVSTQSTADSQTPTLAIDSQDNLHVAWSDLTDYAGSGIDRDILYRYLNVITGIWSTTELVSTQSTADSYVPTLAIDSQDNLHVAWSDKTDYASSGADQDIFYKYLNATTGIWSTTEVVSAESTADSLDTALAIDSQDHLHVAWFDNTDYGGSGIDYDIFYKLLINDAIQRTVTNTQTTTVTDTQISITTQTSVSTELTTVTDTQTETSDGSIERDLLIIGVIFAIPIIIYSIVKVKQRGEKKLSK